VPTAAAYKEAAPWIPAQPADGLSRGDWWKLYGDPDLNALQMRLIEHSPDLAAALSRYDQAKAVSDQMRSGLFPSLALGADTERDGLSNMRPLRPANSSNNYNSSRSAYKRITSWTCGDGFAMRSQRPEPRRRHTRQTSSLPA